MTQNPRPTAAAPITTAGSTGDCVVVGQGVGILSVDFLIVVAVVTGAVGVVSAGMAG